MLKALRAYVQSHPGVSVAELALALQTSPETVKAGVDWLSQRGYLTASLTGSCTAGGCVSCRRACHD